MAVDADCESRGKYVAGQSKLGRVCVATSRACVATSRACVPAIVLVSRVSGEGCSAREIFAGRADEKAAKPTRSARVWGDGGEGAWGAKGTIADELVLVTLVNTTRADARRDGSWRGRLRL